MATSDLPPKGWLGGFTMEVALLVTNASAISRSVTLPPGVWHDYWENGKKSFTSPPLGSVVTYPAPVGMLPLFVRDNSIIAMLPRGQRNIGDTMDEPVLEAHLWTSDIASANASFVVYEDDGVSLQYMSGCFIELELTARPHAASNQLQLTSRLLHRDDAALDLSHKWQSVRWHVHSKDSHKPGRVEGARLLAAAGGGGSSSSSSSAEMVIDTGALESVCFVSIQTTDNKTSL